MKYSILEDPRYSHLAQPKSILFKILSFVFDLYANTTLTFYIPVKVIGRENIPKDTPFIFSSNHNSHMDIAVLAYSTRLGYERFGFLAAKDYWFDNDFRRIFFKNFINLIPLSRRKNPESLDLEDTFTLSKGFVALNNNIIMFPEGSRGEPGVLQRFRKGTAKFSMGLNIPILPAAIIGTEKAWPKGKRFMRPTNITIKILPPIEPKDRSKLTEKAYNKELSSQTKKLEKVITKALKDLEKK
jgi:long-chain acyl-CoA synthetase|tara:strand:+ start:4317 stop:5042 length:726 start_codon:yes stop_codon:yes gene_type:complete